MMPARLPALAPLAAFALLPFASRAGDPPVITGFTPERSAAQRKLEGKFDAALEREELKHWMERLAARPHHIGSAYDRENAEFIASLFKSWGFETRIESFSVLFPVPLERRLELLSPVPYAAKLREPALPEDRTSGQAGEQLPGYNAYSPDGDVTGELVYVNYGVPDDYEALARRGVDVKGKIVIARYGGSWRGIKPKVAAEHGAIGCLIYSDPRDDGYFQGDEYPQGAFRPADGVQRGSIMDMPVRPGDPLTPGAGATPAAKRLPVEKAETLVKIPTLPLSWGDAQPLLKALAGPMAPESWRGALPLAYHLGPGPAKVRLRLAFKWAQVPIYDVIATLRGGELPDQWILRGNHHDAWVNGAADPVSGQVALLAEAKAVGALAKSGWRPRRTIVYAAWDGEEEGLLGSTEWVEAHADELRSRAALYLNTDGNGRGFLFMGGSPSLEPLVNQAAREVADPQRKLPVLERARARAIVESDSADDRKELRERGDLRLAPLGSGSDFTPFLQHLGVATLNLGFGGENEGGEYHSIYDSVDHYLRFGDPNFDYGVALAKTAGRIVLRAAEGDALPMAAGPVADALAKYLKEVEKLAADERAKREEKNRQIADGLLLAAADPTLAFVAPPAEPVPPFLNLAPLKNGVEAVAAAAKRFDSARANAAALPGAKRAELDRKSLALERLFTDPAGLPGRPWYAHLVFAPGLYTGYGVKTLPGVREAIEQKNWTQAEKEAARLGAVLVRYAAALDEAATLASEKTGR